MLQCACSLAIHVIGGTMKRIIIFAIMFLFMCSSLSAQSVTLLYKEKKTFSKEKTISIFFCDEKGNEPVSEEEFAQSEMVYFAYKPVDGWELKEKDLDEGIAHIYITQQGNKIYQQGLKAGAFDDKISLIIASFPKNEFELAESFSFSNQLSNSQPMILPEKYWPHYADYTHYYTLGAQLADEKNYVKSFSVMKSFLSDKPEVTGLSFHRVAYQVIQKDVKSSIDQIQPKFNMLKLEFMKGIDEKKLSKLDSIYTYAKVLQDSFALYFEFNPDQQAEQTQQKLDTIVTESSELLTKYTEEFKLNQLSIFEQGHFSDNRYAFYIDLLSRILVYSDSIHSIDSLYTVDVENINQFEQQKQRLEMLGWLNDFISSVHLINIIIDRDQMVLNDLAMENLKGQIAAEKQPYYEIFSAFNALGRKDVEGFVQYLKEAFRKCTDTNLLDLLELQYLSYLATKDNISGEVLSAINKGLQYEAAGDFDEAEKQYTIATMLVSGYAPSQYYLGRVYQKKGEKYTAEIYFDKALTIAPDYISPRNYIITIAIEDGNYERALELVNNALEANDIWYFYYLKGETLYKLERYDEARQAVLKAIELNGFDFDEHILLGDIFVGLNDTENARTSYSNAGKIDPTNKIFT